MRKCDGAYAIRMSTNIAPCTDIPCGRRSSTKSVEWSVAGSRRNPESNSEIVFLGIGLYQNFNGGYVFNSNWTANANHGPFYLNNNTTSNAGGGLGFRLARYVE